ncbi:MAG: hypothetical protein PHW52_03415 [Candidatus Pacebacteria bacterium]|nr:hypothetical protein [Candidatus Paceibacterota bacterium]
MLESLLDFGYARELNILEEKNIRCAQIVPRKLSLPKLGQVIHPEDCPVISFYNFLLDELPKLSRVSYNDVSVRQDLQVIYPLYEAEAGRLFLSWSNEALWEFSRMMNNSDPFSLFCYFKFLRQMSEF